MKQELKNKMLNKDQEHAVKIMIIDSLAASFFNEGQMLPGNFEQAANKIADKIIKNAQMSLIQTTFFEKSVKNSKTVKKTIKKVTKKNGK